MKIHTKREAAEILRLSEGTLGQYIHRGYLIPERHYRKRGKAKNSRIFISEEQIKNIEEDLEARGTDQ